jgi:hypothetical protein
MENERFAVKSAKTQGVLHSAEIITDRETGVNYLFYCWGQVGGITPLLGKDGKLIITKYSDSY